MQQLSRRSFISALGAAALLPGACKAGALALPPEEPPRYLFFHAAEAQFIEAACERLIPADAAGGGATLAGVPAYLDRQLAGPWGAGRQPYRDGPWQPGSLVPAGRCAAAPAALFRDTLHAVNFKLASRGTIFSRLSVSRQEALLRVLQNGSGEFSGIAARAFFALLLTLTVEGFFSNPQHGAGRDRIAWPLSAFPGAYASLA